MDQRYAAWSKARRYQAAIDRVMDEGWTQTEAAERYGISRQHLSKRVKAKRVQLAEQMQAKMAETPNAHAISGETRRVPATIGEFVDTYFTDWRCPDCGVHHDVPEFHSEISRAIRGDSKRVLINIPPYHSKSTVVTVWDTVMDIASDPNTMTIIVSKSTPFARTFVHSIAEILTNDELYANSKRNLIQDWGPFKPEGQATWSQTQLYVAGRTSAEKDPTVLAQGVGTQIYGRRAHKIKFDDVATLDNQRNPESVLKILEWIDKEALSRIGFGGKAIWVGTRVHHGDIYSVLQEREGYQVIRYPALADEHSQEVLWGEHFPFEQVMMHKLEMKPADFQLVYQNVDMPGVGASFTQDMIDEAKDPTRVVGHYEPHWRLIAGIDPAGGNKDSGYTAFTLMGVDLTTGRRYMIDQVGVKAMKAPQMKDQIFTWTDRYPIYEWRVESNGLQSQLVQYNTEIIQYLAKRGVRVVPHFTHQNKWDPQFGVESMAPLLTAGLWNIPWGNKPTRAVFQPWIDEALSFPMGRLSDRIMSSWFADLGCRDLLQRAHMPLFNSRQRVPKRIARRRQLVDFHNQEIRPVPIRDQRAGHLTAGQFGYRRATAGMAVPHSEVREFEPEEEPKPMNVGL